MIEGYYEQEPENNTFQDVIIDVTHRCNMTCKNCYIPNREIPDLDMDKMLDAISKFPQRTMIRIIGAEPTMRKDLPEMIQRIRKTGNRCTLLTNGLRLAKDNYVKKLKQHGLRHCYLSMNGADNDDYYEQIDEMRCATLNSGVSLPLRLLFLKGIVCPSSPFQFAILNHIPLLCNNLPSCSGFIGKIKLSISGSVF